MSWILACLSSVHDCLCYCMIVYINCMCMGWRCIYIGHCITPPSRAVLCMLFLHADMLHASLPAIAEVRSGVSMSPHQPLNQVIVTHTHTHTHTPTPCIMEPYWIVIIIYSGVKNPVHSAYMYMYVINLARKLHVIISLLKISFLVLW